jgi:hypothetical protein
MSSDSSEMSSSSPDSSSRSGAENLFGDSKVCLYSLVLRYWVLDSSLSLSLSLSIGALNGDDGIIVVDLVCALDGEEKGDPEGVPE